MNSAPPRQGLYRPEFEHDACGVGFICDKHNQARHDIVADGLEILENLVHRGASGANPTTGDGAGILLQIPHELFTAVVDFDLPVAGRYGVGFCFLPQDKTLCAAVCKLLVNKIEEVGLTVLGWRDVPGCSETLNDVVRASEPCMRQVFVGTPVAMDDDTFELKLYFARRHASQSAKREVKGLMQDEIGFYLPSFSSRTIVYKGMFLADQVVQYYPDLTDKRCKSAIAMVHQRFSTNTFPSWKLAHPYRVLAHNGEINTVRGNVNNMLSRQCGITNDRFGEEIKRILPLVADGLSDSGTFDNCLELLMVSGYSPAQAVVLMIPEAWQHHPQMDPAKKAFYQHQATMMEPWDGPALIAFTNGHQIGAMLDRNGLRPARYIETKDGRVVMGSEAGVIDIPDADIVKKWRLEPGRMLLIDLELGTIVADEELKDSLAGARPYVDWVRDFQLPLSALGDSDIELTKPSAEEILKLQLAYGYTQDDLKFILDPMVSTGQEPIGSMGDDTPQAVLSEFPRSLTSFFRQEFAQVTNPPIDPIREELVMGTNTYLGRRPNLLAVNAPPQHTVLVLDSPILTEAELAKLLAVAALTDGREKSVCIAITHPVTDSVAQTTTALEDICDEAEKLAKQGISIIVLSDRETDSKNVALPMLLVLSAVHHRLIDTGLRTRIGLVVDTASAREIHDFAVLIGFGVEAICPYLAYWTIERLRLRDGDMEVNERLDNYRAALRKGLLKVMSKMGVSTIQSFCGAQLFEAVGLSDEFIDKYFCRAISQIQGIGLPEVIADSQRLHTRAYGQGQLARLNYGGDYSHIETGESHMWSPASVSKLQHAVRGGSYDTYREFAQLINNQSRNLLTLRGMLDLCDDVAPIPLDEVEPATEIVRRFATGAMSFGSISWEAHTTLAIAMNRIGGKSNTGEGGEDAKRFVPLANGDSMRSAIKQVASGRFGVSAEYLVNSDMMQIKIAQGAKPGEGGQLPGYKVDDNIAQVRHSIPGVGLISPPPHHDIYSIEDIAQLIHDLKNVNPDGDVSVKLVSRYGVGTVAAGVAKAKSDHITIAGHDGGTGASPLSSIKRAGTPWELGLAETQQTLLLNDLRGRVVLQVDGQIKTGRDVVIGAMLGADEFGFATAPLVAQGCVMMRKCHLNTCPVGIATQDERLRAKFAGKPEHVINYFFFVAEEVRELMAQLGIRIFNELIGRSDLLSFAPPADNPRAAKLDFGPILHQPDVAATVARYHCQKQDHGLATKLDYALLAQAKPAIEDGKQVTIATAVRNSNRTFGTILSGIIAKRYGHSGLPNDTLTINANGNGGQSFGCFLAQGITINLEGDCNDYCGKGLSGGIIAMRPPDVGRDDSDNIISGNVNLYGAISGEAYFRGVTGERFAVRNSGATAVLEGAGDHCCEYMTGGTVVVIGPIGRNFAAGMSGGVAYVYDPAGIFSQLCNMQMVTLEDLSDEVTDLSHLQRSDFDILHELIGNHARRTASPKAQALLDNFDKEVVRFVKVMPLEYRRALGEMATKRQEVA